MNVYLLIQAWKSPHFKYKHKDVFILISLLQINIAM